MIRCITGGYNDSVGQLIGYEFTKNTGFQLQNAYTAIGFLKNNVLVGQAIFENCTGPNVDIHLYSPGCFNRTTVSIVYKYVFDYLKCERLSAKIRSGNEKIYQLLSRLGFEYEFTQERYYKQDNQYFDCLNFKLTRNKVPDWVKLNGSR